MQEATVKKQLKWIVAALAATAIATPAFALTVDTKGFLEIRGQADRNLVNGSDRNTTDNDRTGVDQRIRLWTEAAADENVKAVFAIEADNSWGDTTFGDVGSDSKDIEIKHVYLDFNLPSLNTNVKAGTQYFKIANGYIAGDDASGVQTATKFGDAATLKLYWVKAIEGSFTVTSNDIDFYGAQVDLKAGPLTISPILAWTRNAKNTDIYFGGFDLAGKFGENTKLAATFVKNWGDNLGGQNVDGVAAYAGVFQKMGSADVSLEGAFIGDDGRTGGEFVDGSGSAAAGATNGAWGLSSPTEMLGGARYDARGGIGQALGGATGNSAANLYYLNQAYLKLGFGLQTSDKTKLTAYLAHIGTMTEGVSEAYGQELGAYYDITLAKGLTYSLMGAYLLNDDFGTVGGGNDNVYKLGNALTYKF
jgi:hypothetical protein